ncbi:MAG: hypothetical protein AAF727_15575 [Pseudomonadota bacterium]
MGHMMPNLTKLALAATACLALSGPETIAQTAGDSDSTPEKTIPGISMVSDLFIKFCIDEREDITTLIDLLPADGFTWNADTKRFEHPTHDVSFALLQSELGFACSMQFANHVDAASSAAIFVKKTASRDATVNVGFPDDTSDRNYVQASIAAEAQLTQ